MSNRVRVEIAGTSFYTIISYKNRYLYIDYHFNFHQNKKLCNYNPGHYKIFCVNVKYGIQYGFRIFYLIALQNEENYEREESCSA